MATILVHPRIVRDRYLIKRLQRTTNRCAVIRKQGRVVELVPVKAWQQELEQVFDNNPGPSAA